MCHARCRCVWLILGSGPGLMGPCWSNAKGWGGTGVHRSTEFPAVILGYGWWRWYRHCPLMVAAACLTLEQGVLVLGTDKQRP